MQDQKTGWLRRLVLGEKRDPHSPGVFHRLSLIAIFAWVGLGADGLSSSCYGPPEAYLALTGHPSFSLIVAAATVITVLLISASYLQIIEMFPTGGGGYLVASKLLSPTCGMISGCALLIDYVLTIAISVVSGADAVFSFLPVAWLPSKLYFAVAMTVVLIYLNLRGVRESVLPLVPIFALFLVTHAFLILYAILSHAGQLGHVASGLSADVRSTRASVGTLGMLILLLRAYTMGAGTYTGIEAISNGVSVLREPKVQTAKTTMRYMAVSLSIAVAGLMVAYLLCDVREEYGRTLNASLCQSVTAGWSGRWGPTFVWITLFSEAAILFVAAQTGFLGGPSVLANMAKDCWVPSRFSLLSNRLVVQNGILLIGAAAIVTIILTGASVHTLVILYSINVFITFSFSQLGMLRHWWGAALPRLQRAGKLVVSGAGLMLSLLILTSLAAVKFNSGGWLTLVITGALVAVAVLIKREYRQTAARLKRLDELAEVVDLSFDSALVRPSDTPQPPPGAPTRTAVLLVNGYGGVGLHSLLAILQLFGDSFRRFVFVQVGVIDAASFKGVQEIEGLRLHTESEVARYVQLMRRHGYEAEGVTSTALDVAAEIARLAPELRRKYPKSVFFGGQLVFRTDSVVSRMLHNYTVFSIQRHLYLQGIQFMLLPIRVT